MKSTIFIPVMIFLATVFTACSSEPEIQTVEVTRVVSETEEVEVTRIVDVEVVKEVTRIVEVPVEVTRIIEELVVVTPTAPPPTSTPETPDYGGSENPFPIGETAQMADRDGVPYELTFLEVLRGEEAWQRVYEAYSRNEPAPEGAEWILYKASVKNTGTGSQVLDFVGYGIDIVSQNRIFSILDAFDHTGAVEPSMDFKLLPGGYGEGWVAMSVPIDPEAKFLFDDVYFQISSESMESHDTSLDIESLTDIWSFEVEEDDAIGTIEFYDDGSLAWMFTVGAEPEKTEAGTWEHKGGNTVCIVLQTVGEGGSRCGEWFIEEDLLSVMGDDGVSQVYTRGATTDTVASNDSEGDEETFLDIDDFTDTWIYSKDDLTLTWVFLDDGTYVTEVSALIPVGDLEPRPLTTSVEGTWEYQGGNTVCLTTSEGTACIDWFIEDDKLKKSADDTGYTRQG